MTLAGKVGLLVPPVTIMYIPAPVYLIARFDRRGVYPNQTRRHIIDACQVCGLYAGAKYRLSHVDTLIRLVNGTGTKASTRIRLFRWVLYNALIGNGDAHLKNLSFYVDGGACQLAPHYDLLSTIIYDGKNALSSPLSQQIGNAATFDQLTPMDMRHFGEMLGLPEKLAQKEIDRMLRVILTEFDALYAQVEGWPMTRSKASDLTMLREIKYIVLLPMIAKLTGAY
jgi:serine/threonine-protein kinase HipA